MHHDGYLPPVLTLVLLSRDVGCGAPVDLEGEQHLSSSVGPRGPLQLTVVSAQEEEGIEARVEAGRSASQIHGAGRHQRQQQDGLNPEHLCSRCSRRECVSGQVCVCGSHRCVCVCPPFTHGEFRGWCSAPLRHLNSSQHSLPPPHSPPTSPPSLSPSPSLILYQKASRLLPPCLVSVNHSNMSVC